MKLNPEYILRQIAGESVIVPTGTASQRINGLINLNDAGAAIWKGVAAGHDQEKIVELLLEEFDIDPETARKDVAGFCAMLLANGFATE